MPTAFPNATWLTTVAGMEQVAALDFLQRNNQANVDGLRTLAAAALSYGEIDPRRAETWLDLAATLRDLLRDIPRSPDDTAGAAPVGSPQTADLIPATVDAQLAYAAARLLVHRGQLADAESALYQAQEYWRRANDNPGFARTLLGLTQILAMQGRYAEAERAAHQAIALLAPAITETGAPSDTQLIPGFDLVVQRAGAHHNLATLLLYTERHAAALAEYAAALQLLEALDQSILSEEERHTWTIEVAHNELNRAGALTFLDQPDLAETALRRAGTLFLQVNDSIDHGRVQTNLGRLYLRTGQYAAALSAFDRATIDLLGDRSGVSASEPFGGQPEEPSEAALPTLETLRQADELLLEQAMAYLVMNLLPEAEQALTRCDALFRTADQPYELGQTLYTLGLVRLRTTDPAAAEPLLAEALTHFAQINNRFWLNRTMLAQATLAYSRGDQQSAVTLLDLLIADVPTSTESNQSDPVLWDIGGLVELYLLRLRIALELGQLAVAQQWAATVAALIGARWTNLDNQYVPDSTSSADTDELADETLPHYALRLYHLLGRLARAQGMQARARSYFQRAITLLESTRSLLPVEEIRTAFLDDKAELYADLILLLLDQADADPTALADAFAAVERARSRALLERLLAATGDAVSPRDGAGSGTDKTGDAKGLRDDATETTAEVLRQRLHWLYNQLLGESGSRRLDRRFSAQLLAEEAALKQIEWRQSTLLQQAQPTDLAAFQAALGRDQQAVVYAILETKQTESFPSTNDAAGSGVVGEVMAFLIDRQSITPYRHLTTTAALEPALEELRFQLGRAELGAAYLSRHYARLQIRLHHALVDLYQQLLAPLRPALTAPRLLIVPFGPLHRLPFHALWDGQAYLLEQVTCSYAPSASVVVMRNQRTTHRAATCHVPFVSWAGLAVDDAAIPAARAEVVGAARCFADAQLYLDHEANRQGLERAAQADVLHLATHGLFRPDNPFFSALKLADGWINVRELYRLPLQARLVVLSACESGAGTVGGGDEVVGLARGFLGAGAREVLASLWNVHDESAVAFMQDFYNDLTKKSTMRPADALRSAQRNAIANRLHPYYWAAFYVIGD